MRIGSNKAANYNPVRLGYVWSKNWATKNAATENGIWRPRGKVGILPLRLRKTNAERRLNGDKSVKARRTYQDRDPWSACLAYAQHYSLLIG